MPAELPPVRVHNTTSRVRPGATDLVEVLGLDSVSVLTEQLIFQ